MATHLKCGLYILQKLTQLAMKASIMVRKEEDNLVNNTRPIQATPRSGGSALWQPMFDRKVAEKYKELCNFEIQVKNIFMTNNYYTQKNDRVPVILNWVGQEGLRLMQPLKD